MNDVVEPAGAKSAAKPTFVRPRDAASLILLRGHGNDLELLAGRRPGHVKFMPGVYVFPGGAIDPEDRRSWAVETASETLVPRLRRSARAALRETWEEVGVLVGRPAAVPIAPTPHMTPTETAYAERGLCAAIDVLTYVGRAITPTPVSAASTPASSSPTPAMSTASRNRATNSKTWAGIRSAAGPWRRSAT